MRLILVLLSLVLLSSCNLMDVSQDVFTTVIVSGKQLYHHPDFDSLDTHEKISAWIDAHVVYDMSRDIIGIYNSPKDTINLGYGTCADFAILYMNIAYYGMHEKSDFCSVFVSRKIEAGGQLNHAIVRFGNTLIEPQSGRVVDYTVRYSNSFKDVFGI